MQERPTASRFGAWSIACGIIGCISYAMWPGPLLLIAGLGLGITAMFQGDKRLGWIGYSISFLGILILFSPVRDMVVEWMSGGSGTP